jgi:hypothetical protein
MERVVAEGGPQMLAQTLTRELVPIDDIIGKHFDPAPDVLSIDTEGLDLDILRTLDLSAHRPAVICAETLRYGTTDTVDEVSALLTAAGYVARGGTFVNTIFVDGRRLAAP